MLLYIIKIEYKIQVSVIGSLGINMGSLVNLAFNKTHEHVATPGVDGDSCVKSGPYDQS